MVSLIDFPGRHRPASACGWSLFFVFCLIATCRGGLLQEMREALALSQAVLPIDTAGRGHGLFDVPSAQGSQDDDTRSESQAGAHVGTDAQYGDALPNPLEELHHALETMQDHYFALWLGTWPTAIDWTAAVMGTHVSATLYSLSRSLEYVLPGTLSNSAESERVENEINKYFSQAIAYYFGENAFAIRTQAYDDMLWVVLGWLESIKFINLHNDKHYPSTKESVGGGAWYGKQFEATFAHRARVFYDLASKGWDTTLCGGGMIWNPHLGPYKNAITNELFISASIGMYLYFPGDKNTAPFSTTDHQGKADADAEARPHDPKYLHSAIEGYAWLRSSNMTNKQGLYTDGFHIRGYGRNGSIGTGKCDERNEMVYTYNQGVLLSGLRDLWEGTGQRNYLEDGHELIRNVIAATGWTHGKPNDSWDWAGLGRNGVLEEVCDSSGTCSQNGQTFKGIFFHHLTLFCEPLPRSPRIPGKTYGASPEVAMLHAQSCKEYVTWVTYNAQAALKTRDGKGDFGMWWGRPAHGESISPRPAPLPQGAVDYKNLETDSEKDWLNGHDSDESSEPKQLRARPHAQDVNDRGRGRTVETQGGGVAVLRAMWELISMYKHVP